MCCFLFYLSGQNTLKRCLCSTLAVLILVSLSLAQSASKPSLTTSQTNSSAADSAAAVSEATVAAHGGDKFKKMSSFLAKGTVDLNFMGQSIPGAFATAIDGRKYRFELNTAFQDMKQVCDGERTISTFPGVTMPPLTEMGFFALQKIGTSGYGIQVFEDPKKKRKGFRITTPEGVITDFFVDEKTRLVSGYESTYEIGGRTFKTLGEIDKYLEVDGLMIPQKYSQKFDFGQMVGYANFNAKNILVNPPMASDAFGLPK